MNFSRVALDGDWQLTYFPESEHRPAGPDELAALDAPSVPATVPGNVELDLQAAGVLPEPFYANNIRRLRPYEFNEWWYTRDFAMPAETPDGATGWDLVFAGLDTIATVWVNGVEVGACADMLIEQRFDVSAALRPGQTNRIAVRIGSAVNYARGFHYEAAGMSWEGREETLYLRKPASAYGWDIMPRAVSAGIWRSVWLEARPADAITQLYFWTAGIDALGATVGVRYQFRTAAADLDGFTLRFHGVCQNGDGEHSFGFEWPAEFVAGGCRIPVPGARLWWPHGYGAPNLYTVNVQLCRNGQTLAERAERVGIRKLVVDRTETAGQAWFPEPGGDSPHRTDAAADPASHFLIIVNNQPIMVKGANWVPLDAFHSRDASRVDRAVGLFADLGCNMIRCWGGNVYEDHRFFDLCDENGIMVWQDMSFACCRYPQDEAFLALARVETRAVAEKLRNHPSLAIWCGDNEIDGAYLSDGLSPQRNRLTREVIPQTLAATDPYRAYVPSSPYVPPRLEADPALTADFWVHTPEQHLWGPRGYFKSPFYLQHSAHFIGEIGYHGCPNVSSIRRFISPEHLWPWQDNDEWQVHAVYHWQHHAVVRDRIELMANQVRELFGAIPDDLDAFALASQITQAEAKKFFIESTRLRKWRTSGILWWNVIDGWPQFSDAIVDYYFGRKLAYHYIRRSQQPVAVIIGESGAGLHLPVVICNDTLADADVRYRVTDADSGETVVEGSQHVPANQNWQVGRVRTFASDQRLYLMQWEVDGATYGSHYLAGRPPFALDRYRGWLTAIAALPQQFDAATVAQ